MFQPSWDHAIVVFCGTLQGKLHLNLFKCPGIHAECVEFQGELISPSEFCRLADKDRQKDWKGSIRVGKRTLRHAMDTKAIDFHDHINCCSGRCHSRNNLYSKDQSTANQMNDMEHLFRMSSANLDELFAARTYPDGWMFEEGNEVAGKHLTSQELSGLSHDPEQSNMFPCWNGLPNPTQPMNPKLILNYMDIYPINFWTELCSNNMLGEMVATIKNAINNFSDVNLSLTAPVLSRLVHVLNLEQFIVKKTQQKQSELIIQTQKSLLRKKAIIQPAIRVENFTGSGEIGLLNNTFLKEPRSKIPRFRISHGSSDEDEVK